MLVCLYMENKKSKEFSGYILLTSTGFSDPTIKNNFIKLVQGYNKPIAIITTASEEKEGGKYVQLAYNDFLKMGFSRIDFIDFENQKNIDLSIYDIFYVAGGNTFKLLKYSRLARFDKAITKLLQRGGIYIGVSAGSIIMGPDIKIAGLGDDPDINNINLDDLRGFSFVEYIIYPHYDKESEKYIKDFENSCGVSVVRLSNSQAILISRDSEELIS